MAAVTPLLVSRGPVTALLSRALDLLALAVAPGIGSPEPAPPADAAVSATVAGLALAAIAGGAILFARRLGTTLARVAAGLALAAVAAAVVGAAIASGDGAPLLRAAPFVAPFVWFALAVAAAAAAELWLGSSFKHRRMAAAVVTLGLGAKLLTDAGPLLGSPPRMWAEVLRRDPTDERAMRELGNALLRRGKQSDALVFAERCLARRPDACACQVVRARALVAQDAPEAADAVGRTIARCPDEAARQDLR